MIDSNNLISLLEEDDVELQITGLELINANIEHVWHEVSESIPRIEALSECSSSSSSSSELRSLASIVLSKIYFHLSKLEESLKYALCSGQYFAPLTSSAKKKANGDVTASESDDEFTSTLLHYCIDKYIRLRTQGETKGSYFRAAPRFSSTSLTSSTSSLSLSTSLDGGDDDDVMSDVTANISSSKLSSKNENENDDDETFAKEEPSPEMEHIVESVIRGSVDDININNNNNDAADDDVGSSDVELGLGLAIDCRRADLVSELLERGHRRALEYCRRLVMEERVFMPLEFRAKLLRLLEEHYRAGASRGNRSDYFVLARCLVALNKPGAVADLLSTLTASSLMTSPMTSQSREGSLIALQIAFDLAEREPQGFLRRVMSEGLSERMKAAGAEDVLFRRLGSALSGNAVNDLSLDFLYGKNHSDMYLISCVKAAVDEQSGVGKAAGNYSVCRDATLAANALMHAGTSVDAFVRANIDWLGDTTYWSTFNAIAGLGAIHRGHHKHALKILRVYLPDDAGALHNIPNKVQGAYSEGGAFYALGLIHAGRGGAAATEYLSQALDREAAACAAASDPKVKEMVVHGCCLGLGLAALATSDSGVTDKLWDVVLQPEGTVPQEAAALAIGLVNIGSAPSGRISDMLAYARETPHDRTARTIGVAVALTLYGRQEAADAIIDTLVADKNPDVRFGGMYAVGLAYSGTCASGPAGRLLAAAVSDVSDDVRRAALVALGLVLYRTPGDCPRLVALLTDSFNPHVRYGAAMALGIACAGSALPEALALLEPMTNDPVDFVRQGAIIALAMVLIQASPAETPRAEALAKKIFARIRNNKDEVMSKMGAILASGIVNAGGRNVTIAKEGFKAAAGLAVFSLYWYWFPYVHFLTLAFAPTAVITLDPTLKKVSLKIRSNAPPSVYAYPKNMEVKSSAGKDTVTPASVLNYGRVHASKKQQPEASSMEVEEKESKKDSNEEEKMKIVEEEKEENDEKEIKEPSFEILETPCRVTPRQAKVIKFEKNDRYVPVKDSGYYGIVIVNDLEMLDDEEGNNNEKNDVVIEDDDGKDSKDGGLKARPEGTRNTAAANADKEGNGDGDKKEPPPPVPFTLSDDD